MLVMLRTPEDITTEETIILLTEISTSTRNTAAITIPNEEEVDDVSTLIERKF